MKHFTGLLIFLLSCLNCAIVSAQPSPDLIDIGPDLQTRAVTDQGDIAVNRPTGIAAIWIRASNTFSDLSPLTGGQFSEVWDLNNNGQAVGSTRGFPSNEPINRGTFWNKSGSGIDLGATSCAANEGGSVGVALNNSGLIVGNSTTIVDGNCQGNYPAAGNPLALLVSGLTGPFGAGTSAQDVNDAGTIVGFFPGAGDWGIFAGGSITPIGSMSAKAILSDGTIVGNSPGNSQNVVVRAPDGTVTPINCPGTVAHANDAGDILIWQLGTDGLKVWHEGTCYKLSQVLPADKQGYTFNSNDSARINKFGQIATQARRPVTSVLTAVLLTPQYPFSIQIIATPTGVPEEYEFEAVATKGVQDGTTTWDFGDGSTPVTTSAKVKKKFEKAGTFTVKATSKDSQNRTATTTFVVVVKPPTLTVTIAIPNFEGGQIPLGTDFVIAINVAVLNDGAGEIKDIAFQGGTFTASNSDVLSYTTAGTSPFTLSPGSSNSYPLNVKAAAVGPVDLTSLVIGTDTDNKPASATHSRTVFVSAEEEVFSPSNLKASVGQVKSGKAPVKIENLGDIPVSGRYRLLKGAKPPKSGKETEISKQTAFNLPARGQVESKAKLNKAINEQIKNGKKVKVRIEIEILGAAGVANKLLLPLTLSKKAPPKKKSK